MFIPLFRPCYIPCSSFSDAVRSLFEPVRETFHAKRAAIQNCFTKNKPKADTMSANASSTGTNPTPQLNRFAFLGHAIEARVNTISRYCHSLLQRLRSPGYEEIPDDPA